MSGLSAFKMNLDRALSHSQIGTFHRCRQQYAFKYVYGLKPLARDQDFKNWLAMTRGTLIHAGMEGGLLGESVAQYVKDSAAAVRADNVLSDEQRDALPGMEADSIAVANDALAWLPASDWEPVQYKGAPMVEAKLELPLPPWKYGWVGYADLVAMHKPTRLVFVLDYKSREKFESDGYDVYNSQFPMYQKALSVLGIECHGSLTFEIKPEPPKSKPKKVREDSGLVTSIRTSHDGRFKTTPTLRSPTLLNSLWEDTQRVAKSIAGLTPDQVFRNMSGWNCAKCQFRQLCVGAANGEDVADIIAENFAPPAARGLKITT